MVNGDVQILLVNLGYRHSSYTPSEQGYPGSSFVFGKILRQLYSALTSNFFNNDDGLFSFVNLELGQLLRSLNSIPILICLETYLHRHRFNLLLVGCFMRIIGCCLETIKSLFIVVSLPYVLSNTLEGKSLSLIGIIVCRSHRKR